MHMRAIPMAAGAIILTAVVWLIALPDRWLADRAIVSVALSPNGQVAAGTAHGKIAIWNGVKNPPRHIDSNYGVLNDLRFSPDGRTLAVANRRLSMFSMDDLGARVLRADDRNYGTIRFSPDGTQLLTVSGTTEIEVIDVASGSTQTTICCSSVAGEVGFTPEGKYIVNAGHEPRVWDVSGRQVAQLAPARSIETLVPVALTERRVFMGSQDGRVYEWDSGSFQLMTRSPAQSGYVETIAALEDGSVIYARRGGPIRLWNSESGEHRIFSAMVPASNVIRGPVQGSVLFGTAEGSVELRSIRDERLLQRFE